MDFSALDGHQDMLSPGTPDIARLRADAIPLLTQLDELEHLQTKKVLPLPAGMWNALYRLEPAGVVAKLSVGDNAFEVNFLREAGELGVPVPQVFSAGKLKHAALPNVTYFLMSYVPNSLNAWPLSHTENGMTETELRQLGAGIGQALAKLHTVPLGYVTRFGTRVDSWKQALTDGFSPDWDHIAPNGLFDEALVPRLERALKKTKYFEFTDGTLTHCDLNLSNVLVDAETHQLRAILDPAGYAGMPMWDLAYASMRWDYGEGFYQAMVETYQQQSDKFDADLFYVSMLVVAYRHDRFHTATVREAVSQEILPKLGE